MRIMPKKYVSPWSGKKLTPHQFLASLVVSNKEADLLGPMSESAKKGQYVASARIVKRFPGRFEDIVEMVAKEKIKSLFPLIWNDFTPIVKKLNRLDNERAGRVVNKGLSGDIERL